MDINQFIVEDTASVGEAISVMNKNGRQIVFVCQSGGLVAAIADGDIRRFIVGGGNLADSVCKIANYNVKYLPAAQARQALDFMRIHDIEAVPVVNEDRQIIAIHFRNFDTIRKSTHINVPVVIMAGGKGTRLTPYTDILPKPLIPVGDMTITEHIIDRFINAGCDEFTMIVNHKKGLIKAYFNETPSKGNLRFVDEMDFLGTGGGLKLLERVITSTFFVTNCDILIDADYENILTYHRSSGAIITMVCADKRISVPYGIVELNEVGKPMKLVEKPEFPILTNTGLYVVEPELLSTIKLGEVIHMTELISRLMDEGKPVGVYIIAEADWQDMGQMDEFTDMKQRFAGVAL